MERSEKEVRYWKIAPGEGARYWDLWRLEGIITIGWNSLGDIGDMDRDTFIAHRDQVAARDGWSATGADQVWRFAREMAVGDRVVANHGKGDVLGIGTITGDCRYVPDAHHVHQRAVRWDDLTLRPVAEYGWQRTLIELTREKFEAIQGSAPTTAPLGPDAAYAQAIQHLRQILKQAPANDEFQAMVAAREQVLDRYGAIFSSEYILQLTAEEFRSFLRFENNQHWSGLARSASVATADMDLLRQALAQLVDESLPLTERFDQATGLVRGLGKAVVTAVLLVAYPDRYGVWNNTSEKGLEALDLWPTFERGVTEGERYEQINELLLRIAEELGIDLWTLDALWWMVRDTPPIGALAEPFSLIFRDREEAEWAFGLLRETLERLGVTDANDPRVALTVINRSLRLNFGNWQLIRFGGRSDGQLRMRLALLDSLADGLGLDSHGTFSTSEDEPSVTLRGATVDMIRQKGSGILDMYWKTLDSVAERLRAWQRTPYYRAHEPRIADVLFNSSELASLLDRGFDVDIDSYFSTTTFDLLAQLVENPTNAFYQAHKEEFVEHVEEPFKAFLRALAERLPPMAQERLETEKHIFSRIPKNDYGQGGAWPHYWGAFYPKTGRRTADAQLTAYMNSTNLVIGFYIGEYGDAPKQRFWRNVRAHRDVLLRILAPQLNALDLRCGDPELGQTDWRTWLAQDQPVPDVDMLLTPEEAAAISKDDLIDLGQRTFEALFPLTLLAMDDDPLPAIQAYLGEEPEEEELNPPYPLEQLAADTGFLVDELRTWLTALAHKGQAVLYGPPGTGKTFMAKQLARHLVADGDGLVETLQFHPAYAYEDFIGGLRPVEGSDGRLIYRVVPGRFIEFCRQAAQRRDTCVLIIDEINRAELARVFGELMYLLEYRDEAVPLAVGGSDFSIPKNVRILGTMNTADRSIALVDHALRRRFAFVRLQPKHDVLRAWHQQHTGWDVSGLLAVLNRVNARIADENYEVGISFFFLYNPEHELEGVWRTEIEPYLEEYFFDQPREIADLRWEAIHVEVLGT